MQTNQSMILSLGGGTPCYFSNHELFFGENVIAIYLKASIETLLERISSSNSNRPLLANKTEVEQKEFIAKHLFDRSYYYHQAQYSVVVDAKSPEQIVAEILAILA
jgi:shikimate kinase